ncbi:hypothetical protein SFRURICE_004961 [Spodoptera frugiperda]|nr:hypothetical protein SFRURICE_004961 [Spodoptera frugiperda]
MDSHLNNVMLARGLRRTGPCSPYAESGDFILDSASVHTHAHNVTPFIPEGVGGGAHYGTLGATTEKFSKIRKKPSTTLPTRESNPRPLVRQSHLRPLDQRGSQCFSTME